MALKFQPKEKTVVMCDFSGFKEPEMVKVRPVVVLAKHKHNARLVTIVPLSTTEPYRCRKTPSPNEHQPTTRQGPYHLLGKVRHGLHCLD